MPHSFFRGCAKAPGKEKKMSTCNWAEHIKVGDWVELTDGTQCRLIKCFNSETGHWLGEKVDGNGVLVWERDSIRIIARKLKPSEVVIDLGSEIDENYC
jgi:hypothetical protein